MKTIFSPCWKICVDESMIIWTNEFSLGWITVKMKLHPFGNKYHIATSTKTKIIFYIELVEGKDRSPEVSLQLVLNNIQSDAKTIGLLL